MKKIINKNIVELAPELSYNNKSKLEELNSCYFCCNVIKKDSIKEFTDRGKTALCSFCGIDSVIPGEIDKATLEATMEAWFSANEKPLYDDDFGA